MALDAEMIVRLACQLGFAAGGFEDSLRQGYAGGDAGAFHFTDGDMLVLLYELPPRLGVRKTAQSKEHTGKQYIKNNSSIFHVLLSDYHFFIYLRGVKLQKKTSWRKEK